MTEWLERLEPAVSMTAERDPLKDAEARVRALTREVGSLREDLRRETKRRDRAIIQVCSLMVLSRFIGASMLIQKKAKQGKVKHC